MSHISYLQFVEYCNKFLAISSDLGDSWVKTDHLSQYGTFYLTKKTTQKKRIRDNAKSEDENESEKIPQRMLEDFNKSTLETDGKMDRVTFPEYVEDDPSEHVFPKSVDSSETVVFEYNIVYGICHSVPVLCFEAYHLSGIPLTINEVWFSLVDDHFFAQAYAMKWETLTMTEHPVKGSPCYMIHPCKTAELLRQVQFEKKPQTVSETDTTVESTRRSEMVSQTRNQEVKCDITNQRTSQKSNQDSKPCEIINNSNITCSTSGENHHMQPLDGAQYIISWLSMFGPVIGLKLDINYFKVR